MSLPDSSGANTAPSGTVDSGNDGDRAEIRSGSRSASREARRRAHEGAPSQSSLVSTMNRRRQPLLAPASQVFSTLGAGSLGVATNLPLHAVKNEPIADDDDMGLKRLVRETNGDIEAGFKNIDAVAKKQLKALAI